MSSKAWYKTSAPVLIRKFLGVGGPATGNDAMRKRSVEVWTTTCIVTNFGMKRGRTGGSINVSEANAGSSCSVLINPANPSLSGVADFPYFPRGGPQPKKQPTKDAHHIMGFVTQWGGMDVGEGMMFSAAVVDGLVHQLGGVRLAAECKLKGLLRGGGVACPEGTSIVTSHGGPALRAEYDHIVHTVPPFFNHPPAKDCDVVEMLMSSYRSSFDLAFGTFGVGSTGEQRVAVPLLGAGCRGFPVDIAVKVAAEECTRWMHPSLDKCDISGDAESGLGQQVVAFGLLEEDIAMKLIHAIEESSSALEK
uniref:Macro domain-containing protein n=1 Tax=Minutocellus polymorphus TaxID=265543 RepID=A0A7S0ABL5_9STRA|mmetsp:Transcript_10431/g.17261  ORF Transcript_10431/g.17261 Transcript_10431/m.17261 type:complete len:307 (+) Transcript_10431:71-991(+)